MGWTAEWKRSKDSGEPRGRGEPWSFGRQPPNAIIVSDAPKEPELSEALRTQPWPERALALLWGYSKLLLLIAVLGCAFVWRNDLRALLTRVSRFEALGVKFELSQLQTALERQAKSVGGPNVELRPGAVEAVLARALRVQVVFQGATVLWVDDAPANNMAFRQVLRNLGASVEPARDTLESLALAATSHFDLIVSDIDRGNENGIDGLRRLQIS